MPAVQPAKPLPYCVCSEAPVIHMLFWAFRIANPLSISAVNITYHALPRNNKSTEKIGAPFPSPFAIHSAL